MFKLLKGRNLINFLGIPLWIFLILKGDLFYAAFILVASILGLGEFYNMTIKKGAKPLRWVGMVTTVFIIDYFYVQPDLRAEQYIGFLIFLVLMTLTWELFSNNQGSTFNILATLGGVLIVPLQLGTAVYIRQFDSLMDTNLTLILVISIWGCDSAAFIFGSLFGKRKIFPRVSPNKSWVGSLSGLIISILIFQLSYSKGWLGEIFTLSDAIIFGLISGFFGQLGDFSESLFKRDVNIKDSGKILQGHGGILDRFDSLLFASPFTYLYILFFIK